MNYIILYKINNYYIRLKCDYEECTNKDKLIISEKDINNNFTKCKNLNSFLKKNNSLFIRKYYVNKNIVLIKFNIMNLLLLPLIKNNILKQAEIRIVNFRLQMRSDLIEGIASKSNGLGNLLKAYTKYTFHDAYSLWIYNDYSKVFTFVNGSNKPKKEYVMLSEETSLNSMISEGCIDEFREPLDSDIALHKKNGMKSISRLFLKIGPHNQNAVINLYSTNVAFKPQKTVIDQLKSLVKVKYFDSLRGEARGLENITNYLNNLNYKSIEELLNELSEKLCNDLFYKESSFLLVDKHNHRLTETSKHHQSHRENEEMNKLVTRLIKDNKSDILISYDLAEEEEFLNQKNKLESPTNWFGVPMFFQEQIVAFFWVMNKYRIDNNNQHIIIPPRPTDYFNLRTIVSILESKISSLTTLDQLKNKLNVHNNFSQVYRHEIRGPISSIVTMPSIIIKKIEQKNVPENEIVNLLKDLESLISYLSFIAKTYDIESLLTNSDEGDPIRLLSELIIPIDKITKRYYLKKYSSNLEIDHLGMHGITVYGKLELFNIVFNALLENAGKYQLKEEGYIKVYAKSKTYDGNINIYIENIGIKIHNNETDLIFNKHHRGQEARSLRIDGSGIGLWMCNKILKKYGGKINLESKFNPVCFKLTLPLRNKNENITN